MGDFADVVSTDTSTNQAIEYNSLFHLFCCFFDRGASAFEKGSILFFSIGRSSSRELSGYPIGTVFLVLLS
jgi:hypothetical protein